MRQESERAQGFDAKTLLAGLSGLHGDLQGSQFRIGGTQFGPEKQGSA